MSKQENLWMITGEETGGSRGNTGFTGGLLGSDPQDEQSAIKGNKSSVSSSKLESFKKVMINASCAANQYFHSL
jgi:hypothetical protein